MWCAYARGRLLAEGLDDAERLTSRAASRGAGGAHIELGVHTQKRARRDEGSCARVPADVMAVITRRAAAVQDASARAGLPQPALDQAAQCLVRAVRLGVAADVTKQLVWSLRPREGMLEPAAMAQLLAALSTPAFPALLRTEVLRWLLLILEDAGADSSQGAAPRATAEGAPTSDAGAKASDLLARACAQRLRTLYRVLFHMLIAASTTRTAASAPRAAAAPPSAADRLLLCEILVKITSRREARAVGDCSMCFR